MRILRAIFFLSPIAGLSILTPEVLVPHAAAQISPPNLHQPDINLPDPARDTPLSEAELIAVFHGRTHKGSYNFKRKNIDTFAFEETTDTDVTIHHQQGKRIDTGRWKINDTYICYAYDDQSLRPACFEIYQRGNCYYHYQKMVFSQSIEGFTARSVIKGDTPDCEPHIS